MLIQMHILTDAETVRHMNRQTDRQTDRVLKMSTVRHSDKVLKSTSDSQAVRQAFMSISQASLSQSS